MADSMELERGFEYHANFIYNQPKLKNKRDTKADWVTSLAVVEFIVELMEEWRYDKTYYNDRDALPGGNVFTEFFNAVNKSSYTIVIVTKGFVDDCWVMYQSQSAFIKLLKKSKRFIAVYVDIDEHHIPQEFDTMQSMSFSDDWRNERKEWDRLGVLISYVPTPVQDTGRDIVPPTSNTPNNRGIQQYPHHARNRMSGLQETQPPDLTRARGSNVLEDSPLNGNVLADCPSSADLALNTIPSSAQSPVDDKQNSNNNHSLNDNQESLRSSAPTQSMNVRSTSSEESTANRLSNDPSDMTTPVDLATTSNGAPPDGEANTTTSGPVQGQSSQTVQREDSMGTDVKRLVSNENQDEDDYSSLNQADVEPDNQASGQFNTLDTRPPQVPLKLEQNVTKSSNTKPLPDQDFDQPNVQDIRLERLKFDDIDQDSGFSDFDSLQRSKNSASISPESIEANRINDQTPSPTTAEYSSPVQTPTCKDPEESTTNRLSNDPSDMTTCIDLTTNSKRTPPDGEANATTSGPVQGQSSQTARREDSIGTDVKRLVSNENQDEDDYSSLNQADVEPDNQASGPVNTLDTRAPQMPLKLEQNVIKSSCTKPLPDQDFDQPIVNRSECLKVDDNDQDSEFLDLASLQRSDNSVNISPESIGVNRINDQTPSPTTAGYSSHVQTPTSKDPDSLFNRMTSLIPDREMRSKAVRYFTNMLVKSDQSFM